ncbi:oligosaccharide flippase family protein [Falsigemmobacter faecalis]|uniref:Polysaccharide biosynthesis protein n=1 Tax=Falsigemmobacter faecalis TaxID=2488730 RepID=A0A3P3DQL7_9RHOB|nr:oligosaccharide flippase family protein [Falsigemmobacter faecalis]RRH76234.1 hypothetical protein EG244_07435 [Falsigemmobacter faecalis]
MFRFLTSVSGRGASWTTIGFVASYGIRLLSTLILTRLLAPDVFGLMVLAWVFIGAITMLSDLGTVPSVIRSARGDEKVFLDTAWSVQALRGLGIGVLTLLIAWPVAWLYDQPQLFAVLCAAAVIPVINGLNSISMASVRRHMQLGRLTLMTTFVQIFTVFANVGFAWWLQSIWGLVLGSVAGALFQLLLSYRWLPRYHPRIIFDRSVLSEILVYGRWILLGTLFTYIGGQGSTAVMGGFVPIATLGLISIAMIIASALEDLVGRVLEFVVFPTLARLHREGKPLRAQVGRDKQITVLGMLPGFLLLSLLSQWVIDLFFDPRYAQAGGFLALLALNAGLHILQMPYQNAMLAVGNSRGHSVVMATYSVSRLIFMVLGGYAFGVYGLLAGIAVGTLVTTLVSMAMAQKSGICRPLYDFGAIAVLLLVYIRTLQSLPPIGV